MLTSARPWTNISNSSIFLKNGTLEVISWVAIQLPTRSLSTVQPCWGPNE